MYLLLLLLPLLSFFISMLWGRKLGLKGVKLFSCSLLILSFFSCVYCLLEVLLFNSIINITFWSWINLNLVNLNIGFQFDKIVLSMLLLIIGVSCLVHIYSTSYMENDPHLPRFMSYLSLFTFFMVVLVTSSNLLQLFIGWEGVGLCSYLLVGFWFTRIQANKAAIKAMVINKVGDMGLLLSIILLFSNYGSVNYDSIFSLSSIDFVSINTLNLIGLLLLIGVIGKSAQLGLHMWLPDAMEGPTPVSALIHAATMVTAGVFLIIRMSPFFEQIPLILLLVVLIGSFTAFFTSTIGLVQNDLKKVIAYSTCSQLGYMVMICGFSQYNLSLFHLINHGFFKALLFLSAGSIIHSLYDEQDIRKMGSIKNIIPISYICLLIGSISLMGLPFLTGFYSKDLILEVINGKNVFSYAFWLGLTAAFFTAFYSFRLLFFIFIQDNQSIFTSYKKSHESNWAILAPLLILLILSIIGGYLLQFFILGDFFPVIIKNFNKFLPLLLSLIGAFLSILLSYKILYWWKFFTKNYIINVYNFLVGTWYFDNIINNYIVNPAMKFGFLISYKLVDNQILEYFGPTYLLDWLSNNSNYLSKIHLGKVAAYVLSFIVFVFCFIIKI